MTFYWVHTCIVLILLKNRSLFMIGGTPGSGGVCFVEWAGL